MTDPQPIDMEKDVAPVSDEEQKELDALDEMLEKEVGPANAEADKIAEEERKLEEKFGSWPMWKFVEAIEAVNYLLSTTSKGQKALNKVQKTSPGGGTGMEAMLSKMMGGMMKR